MCSRHVVAVLTVALTTMFATSGFAEKKQPMPNMNDLPQRLDLFIKRPHPRLIIPAEGIVKGSVMEQRARALLPVADAALDAPQFEYKRTGIRLLSISRAAIKRITSLSIAYHLTGDRKYLARAERDLLAVCAFKDWNPSHYLDTAEMMLAVSLGYDWLYNALSEASRKKIADALYQHGLSTALPSPPQGWMTSNNNWAQVCHGGASAAALALADHHREDSLAVLRNALKNLHLPLDSYAPDGVYIEGPGYWGYGTQYTIVFLMLVERSLGTSYGIGDKKYFADSLDFMFHVTGSSGRFFNFADCRRAIGTAETFPWFSEHYGKKLPATLPSIRELRDTPENLVSRGWLYSVVTVFSLDENKGISEDPNSLPLDWHGRGESEMLAMRSDWNPQAWYVGIKAGKVSVPHGHMDIGSFVLDAFGERWAEDPDIENYTLIEKKGINFWDREQNGQRWDVFRCGMKGHNVASINEARQLVKAHATISPSGLGTDSPSAFLDLEKIYGFPLTRQFNFVNRSSLTITDTLCKFPVGGKYRWQMLTQATVRIVAPGILELSQNGKTLHIKNSHDLPWQVVEVEKLLAAWDTPLTGLRRISIETSLPANNEQDFSIEIVIKDKF